MLLREDFGFDDRAIVWYGWTAGFRRISVGSLRLAGRGRPALSEPIVKALALVDSGEAP